MSDVLAVEGAGVARRTYQPSLKWTELQVELLKALCTEGHRFPYIAGRINAETGSAFTARCCIGKAHRLGIRKGRAPTVQHEPAGSRVERLERLKYQGPRLVEAEPAVTTDHRCTLMDLTSKTCRWPMGNPGSADFFFCGAETVTTRPYCREHVKIAYIPLRASREAA